VLGTPISLGLKALIPLACAAAGGFLGWAFTTGADLWWLMLLVAVAALVVCVGAFKLGASDVFLPERPVGARRLMELQRGTFWVLGVVGSAIVFGRQYGSPLARMSKGLTRSFFRRLALR
jgi:hypothetical protein